MSQQNDEAVRWLTGFVLQAAKLAASSEGAIIQGRITGKEGRYQVVSRLGNASRYNLYHCLLPNGRYGVLQIAASTEYNDALDREALALRLMQAKAIEVESGNTGPKPYNYQCFIPSVVETFICDGQQGRRIDILDFTETIDEGFNQLAPLCYIYDRERSRIDPRTAAWILGKTLKILAFAHAQGITNGLVTGSNILVEREQHGVVLFDWTLTEMYPTEVVPPAIASSEIADAARLAISALGGDLSDGTLPESDQLPDDRFQRYVWNLAQGRSSNAAAAHGQFYELIYGLWPRKFHPFTSYRLD